MLSLTPMIIVQTLFPSESLKVLEMNIKSLLLYSIFICIRKTETHLMICEGSSLVFFFLCSWSQKFLGSFGGINCFKVGCRNTKMTETMHKITENSGSEWRTL